MFYLLMLYCVGIKEKYVDGHTCEAVSNKEMALETEPPTFLSSSTMSLEMSWLSQVISSTRIFPSNAGYLAT